MKTILITGSTDGIGKLAALDLATQGHTVIIHGRNPEKINNTILEIKEKSKNPNVSGYVADFSNLNEVKRMSEQILADVPRLDVLINNAGVYNSKKENSEDGYDMRFAVNYFAPYILTNALMPLLRSSGNARIINLSSAAQSPVDLDALQGQTKLSQSDAYAQSKLALTMWSNYLADKEQDLIIIPVNPGSLLNTNMVKEAFGHHWSSADKGAQILTELAVSSEMETKSGRYYDNDQVSFGKAHRDAYDSDKIRKLVYETEKVIL